MTSRFLCFPETALSRRRNQSVVLPKGSPYSATVVRQMIEADAAVGFDLPLPVHPKTGKEVPLEVFMSPAVMRAYKQAFDAHPNTVNLPPMRIVERGTWEHLNALLARPAGVVYVKEDPLDPKLPDENTPELLKTLCWSPEEVSKQG